MRHQAHVDALEAFGALPGALNKGNREREGTIGFGLAIEVNPLEHAAGSQALEFLLELDLGVDAARAEGHHLEEGILRSHHGGGPTTIKEEDLRDLVALKPAELGELHDDVGRQSMGVPLDAADLIILAGRSR